MTDSFAAENIHLALGGRAILRDVSVALAPGEFVCIIGANGAGKSTLLRVLSGEILPDGGQLRVPGGVRLPPAALSRMRAVLPQSVEMAFAFTAQEIVRLGAEAGGATQHAVPQICRAALATVGLGDDGARVVSTLSGGEAQRVHLARALAQVMAMPGPSRFLMMDEPTASLDLKHQLATIDIARRLAGEGVGVLAILHDINLAAMAATRIVALADGRVVADGRPADVIDDRLVETIYDISIPIGRLPPAGTPFLLPQSRGGLPKA